MNKNRIRPMELRPEQPRHITTHFDEQALIEAARRTDRIVGNATLIVLGPWFLWFAWQVFHGLAAKGLLPWQ